MKEKRNITPQPPIGILDTMGALFMWIAKKREERRNRKNTIERLERMVAQAVDLPKGVEPHEWSDYKRSKEI